MLTESRVVASKRPFNLHPDLKQLFQLRIGPLGQRGAVLEVDSEPASRHARAPREGAAGPRAGHDELELGMDVNYIWLLVRELGQKYLKAKI